MYHEYETVYEYGSNAFELQKATVNNPSLTTGC